MTTVYRPHRHLTLAALAGVALLAGCTRLHTVDATFGTSPPDAVPGTYAFDRLPSQELAAAGFRLAADGTQPSVLVQIGMRAARLEQVPRYGELWFNGPRRYGYAGWAPYGT